MGNNFPFVKIPRELRMVIGKPTPGTRVYRREGSMDECSKWFRAIAKHMHAEGGCVSPGGVGMFVPVSRAAVHHRLKKGLLTAFTFYVVEDEKSFFGTTRKRKERPYMDIPVSECEAWAEELKRRQGIVDLPTAKQAEEEETEFIYKDPKDKGDRKVVYKGRPMTREETLTLVQDLVLEQLGKLLPGRLGEKYRKLAESDWVRDKKTGKMKKSGERRYS
jgi:hypothetical protein